jgi:hypothetical protein
VGRRLRRCAAVPNRAVTARGAAAPIRQDRRRRPRGRTGMRSRSRSAGTARPA